MDILEILLCVCEYLSGCKIYFRWKYFYMFVNMPQISLDIKKIFQINTFVDIDKYFG